MTKFLAQSRKAVAGAIVAGAGVAPAVAGVDNELVRYGAIVGAFLVGFVSVWLIPNEPAA